MEHIGQFIVNHWWLWLALVLVLGLIYLNELQARKKQAKSISPQSAVNLMNHEKAAIFDLRDAESFRKGHIIDSIRATAEDFMQQKMDKYKTKPLLLVCSKGIQSATLAAKLQAQGFSRVMILDGGISGWQAADFPLVKGK